MAEYIEWLRERVGTERVLIPTTAAILVNDEGHILLQRRSDTGHWGCPGGLMDLGETVREGLVREVEEETGLTVGRFTLLGVYSGPEFEAVYPDGDRTAPVMLVFIVYEWSGALRCEAESLELVFFPPDALPSGMNRFHAAYLRDYVLFTRGELEVPIIL